MSLAEKQACHSTAILAFISRKERTDGVFPLQRQRVDSLAVILLQVREQQSIFKIKLAIGVIVDFG